MSTPERPTVLVVEDDRDVREALTQLLQQAGYAAAGAAHGREALRWLRGTARPPRLILLDLMLPVMTGWQFRREQQGDPRLAAVPVLVLSAAADVAREAAALDAAGHLTKPVDVDQLLALVGRLCPASP